MVTLYNVTSKDGYIARLDGSEDFIPDELWNDFIDMCKKNDTVVIGRKTYQTIQNYSEQMIKKFEDLNIKRVVVTRDINFTVKPSYIITHSPKEAFTLGRNILLSSGPTLNTSVLELGLIDKVILNILPLEIGSGIKVFNTEVNLVPISEKDVVDGKKLCEYLIK